MLYVMIRNLGGCDGKIKVIFSKVLFVAVVATLVASTTTAAATVYATHQKE